MAIVLLATGGLACEGWRLPAERGEGGASAVATTSTTTASVGGTAGMGGAGAVGGMGNGGAGGEPFPQVDCSAPVGPMPDLGVELVADGFDMPLGIEAAPGEADRLYVLEKTGRIRVIESGQILPTPFLDLSAITWSEGEAGLLGLAFHPDYASNGRFFVYFHQYINNGARLIEYRRMSTDPPIADPTPVGDPLIAILHAHIHNGGALEFSPVDGFLYMGQGERGNKDSAQPLDTLHGKMLRIDVSETPYAIPPGNMVGGLPEIWANGLRNPWRAAFDPCTGELYIADVGENEREEINIEQPGVGQHNYGWPIMEGSICHPSDPACDATGLTLPAHDLTHGPPDYFSAVIGGEVYRGSLMPGLRGVYLFSNTGASLFGLRADNGVVVETYDFRDGVKDDLQVPVAFGRDHGGEVYMVDLLAGAVLRVVEK